MAMGVVLEEEDPVDGAITALGMGEQILGDSRRITKELVSFLGLLHFFGK